MYGRNFFSWLVRNLPESQLEFVENEVICNKKAFSCSSQSKLVHEIWFFFQLIYLHFTKLTLICSASKNVWQLHVRNRRLLFRRSHQMICENFFAALPVTQAANAHTHTISMQIWTLAPRTLNYALTHENQTDGKKRVMIQRTCVICKPVSVCKPNENESDSYRVEHVTNLLNNFGSILYQYSSQWLRMIVRSDSHRNCVKWGKWNEEILFWLFVAHCFQFWNREIQNDCWWSSSGVI